MFRWKFKNNFVFDLIETNGTTIQTSKWYEFSQENISQLAILKELIENGFAEIREYECEINVFEILKLDNIDKQILDLPSPYPYEIYISSIGQLNQNTFLLKYRFYDFVPNGNDLNPDKNGPLLSINNRKYLLSNNQFKLCKAIDEYNSLNQSEKSFNGNLIRFSEIKSLSQEAAGILDLYLGNQNVVNPEKIKVDINYQGDSLQITPVIELQGIQNFETAFNQFNSIRDNYPLRNDEGGITRVVFNDHQKAELEKIKSHRKVTDNEVISKIVEHPEEYFDDEIIDFSVFYSDRVKEIGLYKPKFYPFICPYKSQWIPGVLIKDRIDGEKRIHIKSEQELQNFQRAILEANEQGLKDVDWGDIRIPLHDARRIYLLADKQIHRPDEPAVSPEQAKKDDVLIIKENAEILEYTKTIKPIKDFVHKFYSIKNLNPSIELKNHQKEGIAWLQSLVDVQPGCLLADDMGLGKTLQLLYLIEWHSQLKSSIKPYLVVAPVTLLENWESEYERFFKPNSLDLKVLYDKIPLSKSYNEKSVELLNKKQLILTNYETIKNYQFNICAVDYAIVVLDEAQKIKTPGTLITNVAKALKADFKIAMTGTPVENTLVDIWSIIDFALPGLLGNAKEFAREFQKPLKDENTDVVKLGNLLRDRIGIFIKRRLKQDVLSELPNKIDNESSKIKMLMPPKQLQRYKTEINRVNTPGMISTTDGRKNILSALWNIRDISDHPYLVDSTITNYSSSDLIESSAKLQIMIQVLETVKRKNEKVIIFADRKETQKMLQKVVFDSFNILPSIINGDTPTIKKNNDSTKLSRQQTIDKFHAKAGFNAIVMSQLAAGLGLNVTGANHIIHYSRHWNPAKENQATDRAYRIGQEKKVYVYYPMAIAPDFESFDIILDKLLSRKKLLAQNTLFPTEQAEINPDDLYESVFVSNTEEVNSVLTDDDIFNLNPNLFEAAIAAIFSKQGKEVYLTPNSNDKGADVVVIDNGGNLLIQVKQSKSPISLNAVQEIVGAIAYYKFLYQVEFQPAIVTNNCLTDSAELLAKENKVMILNKNFISEHQQKLKISISDIHAQESRRLQKI